MPAPSQLDAIGWDDDVARRWAGIEPDAAWIPARVTQTDRGEATVWTAPGCELRVRMTKAARAVVAGDWVGVDPDAARVEAILPRRSAFVRRAARGARAGQVLAANMDVVGVLQSAADPGVNPRRLERELVLAHQSGARPLVIITKVDLCDPDHREAALATARAVAPGVNVVGWSAVTGVGRSQLEAELAPGTTVALLGASGVGKSTLLNRLAGRDLQATAEIRSGDGKGRHTTTAARLVSLGNGRLVIDTPGVRALGLWEGEEGLGLAFPEVVEAGERCRFDDCAHQGEPDCAVQQAADDGALDPERLESWRRLRTELDGASDGGTPDRRSTGA